MGDTSHETGTNPIVVALGGSTLLGAHGLGIAESQHVTCGLDTPIGSAVTATSAGLSV